MFWFRLLVCALLAGIVFYTASYGVWEWKNGRRSAACAVFALCVVTAILPAFA